MFISRYPLHIQVHQMTFLRARALKSYWKQNKNTWKLNAILGTLVSGGVATILHWDGKIDSLSSDFAAQAAADRSLAAADRSFAMANSQACLNQFNALLQLHGVPPIPVIPPPVIPPPVIPPPVITSQTSSSSIPAKASEGFFGALLQRFS
jgi:hypothetical protein